MHHLVVLAAALFVLSCRQSEPDSRIAEGSPSEMPSSGMMRGEPSMMGEEMPQWMMSGGSMADMMADMSVIHDLLVNHRSITRTVVDLPNGVRTTTISNDPQVASLIRSHVRQMKERVDNGRPIRMMDPLFREIFRHHDAIEMQIHDIPGGVRVTETSTNPQVQLLIRQHAHRAVSEFVGGGMPRAMQPTPLPAGYRTAE